LGFDSWGELKWIAGKDELRDTGLVGEKERDPTLRFEGLRAFVYNHYVKFLAPELLTSSPV
jgi:hypothetical protein